jgi:putative inorganic carbon (hco3(-)) transporter
MAIDRATIAAGPAVPTGSVTFRQREPAVSEGDARVSPRLPAFAVATPIQVVALLATVAALVVALVLGDRRRRALAMLAAPALAVLTLATLANSFDPLLEPVLLAGAATAGVAVLALAWLVHRRPIALALLVVAALPFRVPVSIGDSAANLLLPLYAVIAAGTLSYAWRALRGNAGPDAEREPLLRWLAWAFAAVLGLYGLQATYSTDVEQAIKNVCLFYVPFALLFLLLLEVVWSARLLRWCMAATVGLALVFAAIGCVEFATGHLLITNAKVVEANDLLPYFRVNSLFFDPNIYGRYLALTMILLAAVLLWTRRRREAILIGLALGLLWAGLVFSLSQSSFAALLLGLGVLAALRWKPWPVLAGTGLAALVALGLVLFAPATLNLETGSVDELDRATSGRANLIGGGLRMIRDRPVHGFGSGAYAERYRERERVSSEKVAAASHTIPLTVTAEQGVIGLAAYLALVALSLALLFDRLRRVTAGRPGAAGIARAGLAAAYSALVLHTLVYAAYLEDPLSWALLAIAAGLRTPADEDAEPAAATGDLLVTGS